MARPAGDRNARSKKPYDRPQARPRSSDGMWVHDMAPIADVPASVVNSGPRGAPPSSRLFVSNLHYNITAKDLISIFGQIGTLVREPSIKYDRSGRSTGAAFVHYETPVEATRAKNQFNGILAKGQPMSVVFEAPRSGKRAVSAPTSLMNRISKPPLLQRLAPDASTATAPKKAVKATSEAPKGQSDVGPVRTRGRRRGGRSEKVKKETKTAEDLDKELDAFMGDDTSKDAAPASAGEADIEMDI